MNLQQKIFNAFVFLLPWQTIYITREIFIQGEKWQWATLGIYATQILLWLGIFLFFFDTLRIFLRQRTTNQLHFQWSKDRHFFLAALVFVIYALASMFWSHDASIASQHALWIMQSLLLFVIFISDRIDRHRLCQWFVGGAVLVAFLALAQFAFQQTFDSRWLGLTQYDSSASGTIVVEHPMVGRFLRSYGSFAHPNIFGGYMLVAIIVAFFFLHKKNDNSKKLCITAVFVLTFGLFFSFSRSAWIGLMLASLVAVALDKQAQKYVFLNLMIFFLLIVLCAPLAKSRLMSAGHIEAASVEYRLTGLQEVKEILQSRVLLGSGGGNYTQQLLAIDPGRSVYSLQPVHNTALLVIAELGLLGFFLLLWGILALFLWFGNTKGLWYLFALAPPFLFDHYLYTSHVGLLLVGILIGTIFQPSIEKAPILAKK
ncbi:O-antigen ligase family protein [Candidatus Nomurabacteria bacterium]|nr:O-antigen ligase family protein [Candidatus Nomurabacteria bacterium]